MQTLSDLPKTALDGGEDSAGADAIASLSNELEALKDARSEERFIWVVSAIIAFDCYVFSKIASWSGPIVIGIVEFVLLLVLARKLGIQEVSQVLAKLLDRAAEAVPGIKQPGSGQLAPPPTQPSTVPQPIAPAHPADSGMPRKG